MSSNKASKIEVCLEPADFPDELEVKNNFLKRLKSKEIIRRFSIKPHSVTHPNLDPEIKPTALQLNDDPDYWLREYPVEREMYEDAFRGSAGSREELIFANIELVPRHFFDSLKKRLKSITKIQSLGLVKNSVNNSVRAVVVNGDYQSIPVRKSNLWNGILEIAEKKFKPFDKKAKDLQDYFNSRRENPIYAKTSCMPTKVLKKEGDYLVAAIKIEVLSDKAVATRFNKMRKLA